MAFWPPPRLLAAQTERSTGPTSPRLLAPGSWRFGLAKATRKLTPGCPGWATPGLLPSGGDRSLTSLCLTLLTRVVQLQ